MTSINKWDLSVKNRSWDEHSEACMWVTAVVWSHEQDLTLRGFDSVHGVCVRGFSCVPVRGARLPARGGLHRPQHCQHGPSVWPGYYYCINALDARNLLSSYGIPHCLWLQTRYSGVGAAIEYAVLQLKVQQSITLLLCPFGPPIFHLYSFLERWIDRRINT